MNVIFFKIYIFSLVFLPLKMYIYLCDKLYPIRPSRVEWYLSINITSFPNQRLWYTQSWYPYIHAHYWCVLFVFINITSFPNQRLWYTQSWYPYIHAHYWCVLFVFTYIRPTTSYIAKCMYYLELHGAISFYYWCTFSPSNIVDVLWWSNNQFDIYWLNMRRTVNR